MTKKEQQLYLAELATNRRHHIKQQIISNMGFERQFLSEPGKILALTQHIIKADSADVNTYYKERPLDESFGDCLFSERKLQLVNEAFTNHAHQCDDPEQTIVNT